MVPRACAWGSILSISCLALTVPGLADDISILDSLEKEIVKIVKEARPAVVSITTEPLSPRWGKRLEEEEYPIWIQNFFKSDFGPRKRRSSGTGFIIDPDGHILTTEDVIGDAGKVSVTLHDGRVLPARVVGKDMPFNIALLKVEKKELPHLSLGKSEKVRIGSWVLTLGYPFGLSSSPSWGIVSGLGRSGLGLAPYEELIQITAPINPGDSGGPVLNSQGEVIGIITGSFSGYREFEFDWSFIRRFHQTFPRATWTSPDHFFQPSQAQGIGFAIPIDLAREVIIGLQQSEKPLRGWLGIQIEENAPMGGVLISSVFPDSPAARTGLREDDIIISLDGKAVDSPPELQKAILFSPIGKIVELELVRQGENQTVAVTIEAQPSD